MELNRKNGHSNKNVDSNDTVTTSKSQRKKSGQHKMLSFLKHWWQLKTIVKAHHQKCNISKKWDEAWKLFVCEELELKKNKKGGWKRMIRYVLPTFEDVLGIGKSEGDYTSGLEVDKDLTCLLCRLLMFRKN
jgi:hypothetical protein